MRGGKLPRRDCALAFFGLAAAAGLLLAACSQVEVAPYLRPLSNDTIMLLGKKGMSVGAPIFVRIFKEESELEVWKQRDDGRFYHFKTYPICNWSGELGPKVSQGDKQAPEGFYTISQQQMNPNSQLHLSFNLGYPNAYDRAHKRTGEFLMVHGKCKSAGCYAMTDALMEEIYGLAREAFIGGQETFEVHAFPFRMTDAKMKDHKQSPHYRFWATLKEGYDYFETTRQLPTIAVCERKYLVNVAWKSPAANVKPDGRCPAFVRPKSAPFVPKPSEKLAEERIVAPGIKMRTAENSDGGLMGRTFSKVFGTAFGLGGGGLVPPFTAQPTESR